MPELDKNLYHMITSGMFDGMFEVLRHDMPKDKAKQFIAQIQKFHMAGWAKIMGQ